MKTRKTKKEAALNEAVQNAAIGHVVPIMDIHKIYKLTRDLYCDGRNMAIDEAAQMAFIKYSYGK